MVKFAEKLRLLTGRMNKSQLSRDAGLSPTVISSYISQGDTVPRADIALRIARVLEVPLEWLVDDSRGWPPAKIGTLDPGQLTDQQVFEETARRWCLHSCELRKMIEIVQQTDWDAVLNELRTLPPDEPPRGELLELNRTLIQLKARASGGVVRLDNPTDYAKTFYRNMPGYGIYPFEELERDVINRDAIKALEGSDTIKQVVELIHERGGIMVKSVQLD